jgi:hypothetical protein
MSTTRFTDGVTNASYNTTLGAMGQLDPSKFFTDFDDFFTYLASDWTITTTGTGTRALASGNGGRLLITNSAANGDANFYQRVATAFVPVAGKATWFKAKFQVDDASLAVIQMGLLIADTTPIDATDGIQFLKVGGSTAIQAIVQKNATTGKTSNANVATLVSATDITLGFYYNGYNECVFFVNDAVVARLDATSTYLPDAPLALTFGVQNGSGVARSLNIDYIMAAQER